MAVSKQNHVVWLDEILSEITNNDLQNSKKQEVQKIYANLKIRERNVSEAHNVSKYDDIIRFHDQIPTYAGLFSRKLNEATMAIYMGKLSLAFEILKNMREQLETVHGVHERLNPVVTYFVECLEWYCWQKEFKISKNDRKYLLKTWQRFQNDRRSQAVLLYMQGSLYYEVLGEECQQIYTQLLRQVMELDPDYFMWYQYYYSNLKILRHQRHYFYAEWYPPTKEEIEMCKRSYELAPEPKPLMSLYHFSVLLQECWTSPAGNLCVELRHLLNFENRKQIFEKCLLLSETALCLAKSNQLSKWVVKITVHLAGVLTYLSENEHHHKRGEALLQNAILEYPNSGVLHYKLGKLYKTGVQSGGWGVNSMQDFEKARYHFREGIRLKHYTYFQCFKGYLSTFPFLPAPLPVAEAVELSEVCLVLAKNASTARYTAQIMIWKGCVLWISESATGRQNAVKAWVEVLREFPELKRLLHMAMSKPPYAVAAADLKREVEMMFRNHGSNMETEECARAVELLLKYRQVKMESLGMADQDNNWRAK